MPSSGIVKITLIGSRHVVSLVDLPQSDAAAHRRQDAAVGQVHLGGVDLSLIGGHLTFVLLDQGLLGVELLLRNGFLRNEPPVALEIDLCPLEEGLIARLLPLHLLKRGFVLARVDLGKEIAFLHLLAFREVDTVQIAADLGSHRHRCQRRYGAERVLRDVDVTGPDGRRYNRHRSSGSRTRCGLSRRRRAVNPPRRRGSHQQKEGNAQEAPPPRNTFLRWFQLPSVPQALRRSVIHVTPPVWPMPISYGARQSSTAETLGR